MSAAEFLAARDLLFAHRTDYATAYRDFRWPKLDRISPFELESTLIEHPAVAEAAVVPSPDPLRLAVPKAFLALAQGSPADRDTALSVFRHVRAHLSPFKRVRRLEFADLPKTISGKIRRVELRATERAHRAAGERGPSEFWEEDFPELR